MCSSDNARTYKYLAGNIDCKYTDLCINCVQEFVLKNQTKLTEVSDRIETSKRIIHG